MQKEITYTKTSPKLVNPRDVAGNTEEEEEGHIHKHLTKNGEPLDILLGTQKKKKVTYTKISPKMVKPQIFCWDHRRRRRSNTQKSHQNW